MTSERYATKFNVFMMFTTLPINAPSINELLRDNGSRSNAARDGLRSLTDMEEGTSRLLSEEGEREGRQARVFIGEDFSTRFSAVYRVLRRLQGRHGLSSPE
jgi:hypothetical protein